VSRAKINSNIKLLSRVFFRIGLLSLEEISLDHISSIQNRSFLFFLTKFFEISFHKASLFVSLKCYCVNLSGLIINIASKITHNINNSGDMCLLCAHSRAKMEGVLQIHGMYNEIDPIGYCSSLQGE